MFNKSVTLPQEKWDRIIELLDSPMIQHPDKPILLVDLHNQLERSPTDSPLEYIRQAVPEDSDVFKNSPGGKISLSILKK